MGEGETGMEREVCRLVLYYYYFCILVGFLFGIGYHKHF